MIGRIALGAGVAAAAAAGVGWAIARRLTAPVGPRMFDLTVRGVEYTDDGDLIVLDRTDQATAPGIYNLWFEHGGWAQLSADAVDRGPAVPLAGAERLPAGAALRAIPAGRVQPGDADAVALVHAKRDRVEHDLGREVEVEGFSPQKVRH